MRRHISTISRRDIREQQWKLQIHSPWIQFALSSNKQVKRIGLHQVFLECLLFRVNLARLQPLRLEFWLWDFLPPQKNNTQPATTNKWWQQKKTSKPIKHNKESEENRINNSKLNKDNRGNKEQQGHQVRHKTGKQGKTHNKHKENKYSNPRNIWTNKKGKDSKAMNMGVIHCQPNGINSLPTAPGGHHRRPIRWWCHWQGSHILSV